MSTRPRIGIQNLNGTITAVYCHYDGYVDHHGPILTEAYSTTEKVQELLGYGSISILDHTIGEKCAFDNCPDGQCLFYGRDRGEEDVAADTYAGLPDLLEDTEEFTYLFAVKPGVAEFGTPVWWVLSGNYKSFGWVKVTEAPAGFQ